MKNHNHVATKIANEKERYKNYNITIDETSSFYINLVFRPFPPDVMEMAR